ncbi:MAG TPA: hypothetical protein VG938_07735 [Verrucomicrobiae bacterium]|jgi:hypothetical protein|nr:hypothetical protein [Verrucomicrobiae bacterium]
MPLELQIIRACEFIRAGAEGRPDMDASRAVLRELASACRRRGIDRALLDLRSIRPGNTRIFTPADLASLVNTFREIGFTYEQRLAVLYSEDPYHGVRMFAFIGALRGWKVRAFGSFESALYWLGDAEGVCEEHPKTDSLPTAIERSEYQ